MNKANEHDNAPRAVQSNEGPNDHGYSQERLNMLLERMEPYRDDLLYRGSIQRLFNLSVVPTYVLKFRQRLTGTGDGRQKTIYIGTCKALRDEIGNILWQWRGEAETRTRPVRSKADRELEEAMKLLKKYGVLQARDRARRSLKELREKGEIKGDVPWNF